MVVGPVLFGNSCGVDPEAELSAVRCSNSVRERRVKELIRAYFHGTCGLDNRRDPPAANTCRRSARARCGRSATVSNPVEPRRAVRHEPAAQFPNPAVSGQLPSVPFSRIFRLMRIPEPTPEVAICVQLRTRGGGIRERPAVVPGHRFYNPGIGRWLNRDPIGEEGGLNLLAFVSNTPACRVDRLGRMTVGVGLAAVFDMYVPMTWPVTNTGLGASIGLQLVVGWHKGKPVCTKCWTASMTVAANVGPGYMGAGGAFIITWSRSRQQDGYGLSGGLGAGIGSVGVISPPGGWGASIDVDIKSGDVTVTVPKVGPGIGLCAGVRFTGTCTGCDPVLAVGAQKLVKCLSGVAAAMSRALGNTATDNLDMISEEDAELLESLMPPQ